MTSFNIQTYAYFEDVSQIEKIFQSALSLKILHCSELPSIPLAQSIPPPSPLLENIKLGNLNNRVKSFAITPYFQKRRDILFVFDLSGKFTEVSKKSLSKDGTFKYCRSAILSFNNEVENILEAYGKFYLYSNFDSFDLKIGTDIREKIIILSPLEYEALQKDIAVIQNWNNQILNVRNESSRLKYRLSELLNE